MSCKCWAISILAHYSIKTTQNEEYKIPDISASRKSTLYYITGRLLSSKEPHCVGFLFFMMIMDIPRRAERSLDSEMWDDCIDCCYTWNFLTWHSFYSHYQDQHLTNCTHRSATPRKWKINIFIINHRSSDNIYNLQTGLLGDHNNTFQRPENYTNYVNSGEVELRE